MAQNPNKIAYPKLAALRLGAAATPTNAVLNLLRQDPMDGASSANTPRININRYNLDQISRETSQEVTDSDAIMQLLPDMELVETVYTGSILDPKALSETDLTFAVEQTIFDSEIGRLLLEPVERYFKRDYKINDRLDLILRDCLFRKGASVLCVLPENTLDSLINGRQQVSVEAYNVARRHIVETSGKFRGFLGHPDKEKAMVSLENFTGDTTLNHVLKDKNLRITDNYEFLRVPTLSKGSRQKTIADKIRRSNVSMEQEMHSFKNDEIEKLYQSHMSGAQYTQVITSPKFMDRRSVGHPLVLPLPMESVIPVHVAGRPNEHIGYFILVDQNGYPVSKDGTRDFFGEMKSSWKKDGSGNNNSEILRLTKEAMGYDKNKEYSNNEIQQTHTSIIVNELNNRLRNGLYDQELDIGMTEDIQRIMLYRNWKAKATQMVFVPVELMVYIAFDYTDDGIGQTLLARSKMIATMRTTLLFAESIGGMRNAVGRKKVNITLDPDDIDPEQTISNVQSNILETAQRAFPLAAPDPTQAIDHLIRSGFDFAINVNGADYAETKVEYDDYNTNVNAGNPDLQDRLRRMHISGMGIPPEKVDPMSSPDFATSIVQNDLVLSRRVREKQKAFCEHLSKLVRVFATNSSIIRAEMQEIIKRNVHMIISPEMKILTPEQVIDEFIQALYVSLPKPDNTQHERQMESMETYGRLLDSALENYISAELFPEELLQVPQLAEQAIAQIKSYFIRQFMAQNNIMPELNILTEMDGNQPAFSLLDSINSRSATLGTALLEWAKGFQNAKKRMTEKFKSVIDEAGGGDAGGGGFDSGGGDSGGGDSGGFGDDSGGGDDGFGGDFGGDDTGGGGDDMGMGGDTGTDDGNTDADFDDAGTEEDSPNLDGLDNPMDAAEKEENDDDASEEDESKL